MYMQHIGARVLANLSTAGDMTVSLLRTTQHRRQITAIWQEGAGHRSRRVQLWWRASCGWDGRNCGAALR